MIDSAEVFFLTDCSDLKSENKEKDFMINNINKLCKINIIDSIEK